MDVNERGWLSGWNGKNVFDLLMENAFLGAKFEIGRQAFAQPVGTAVRWVRTEVRRACHPVTLPAFGPLLVASVRTAQMEFLQEK
jgi:hypothetical protein